MAQWENSVGLLLKILFTYHLTSYSTTWYQLMHDIWLAYNNIWHTVVRLALMNHLVLHNGLADLSATLFLNDNHCQIGPSATCWLLLLFLFLFCQNSLFFFCLAGWLFLFPFAAADCTGNVFLLWHAALQVICCFFFSTGLLFFLFLFVAVRGHRIEFFLLFFEQVDCSLHFFTIWPLHR